MLTAGELKNGSYSCCVLSSLSPVLLGQQGAGCTVNVVLQQHRNGLMLYYQCSLDVFAKKPELVQLYILNALLECLCPIIHLA